MPVISTTKMTARQYLMLGEDPPGVRLELVNGEVAVSPSPRPRHSYPLLQLGNLLDRHIVDLDLGLLIADCDTIFGEYDVRRPDLLFFTKARQHLVQADEAIDGPPDLCVEVTSPSSGTIDRKDKFKQYAEGGVAHYWILDPERESLEGFKLRGKKYVATGNGEGSDSVTLPPFPKLKIPLAKLWFPSGNRKQK
jgi:Uma2 family endonuclease